MKNPTPRYYTQTGYPLPLVSGELVRSGCPEPDRLGDRLWWPVPWINGNFGLKGDFYSFRHRRGRIEPDRLCCICGDPMLGVVAVAALNGARETAGGWGHPKCVHLAVTMCPHFTDPKFGTGTRADTGTSKVVVAYRWDGEGLGLAESPEFGEDPIHPDAIAMDRGELAALAKDTPTRVAVGACPRQPLSATRSAQSA